MNERLAVASLGITEYDTGFGEHASARKDAVATEAPRVVTSVFKSSDRIPQFPKEAPKVLTPMPNEQTWRSSAACLEEDPEQFFANDLDETGNIGRARRENVEATKAICARCIVTDFCLREAIKNDEHSGIWGGLTTIERQAIKRAMRRSSRS